MGTRRNLIVVAVLLFTVLLIRSYAKSGGGGDADFDATSVTKGDLADNLPQSLRSKSKERIVIIGAGVTGLGAAYRLHELGHADWEVYEAANGVGGLAQSVTDENGFTWDYGVHVLFSHFNWFDSLLSEYTPSDEWEYHSRSSPIWMHDRFVGYPLQNNVWQLPPEPLMECLEGLVEVHDQRVRGEPPKPKNFLEWIKQSFGDGIVKHFMAPYNFKVWAHPPIELNSNWVGERVATIDLKLILNNLVHRKEYTNWGPNANFRYPTRGAGVVWERVFKAMPPARFNFGKKVVEIVANDPANKHLVFADGTKTKFDRLISTMPMNKLTALLKDQPQLARWGAEEGSFKFQTVNLVGVGVEGIVPDAWNSTHWVYFPEEVYPFYRITILSNFSPYMTAKPGKQYSVLVEVSESKYRKVDQTTVVQDVIAGLERATVLRRGAKIVTRWHERFEYGYPVPYVERDFHVHRIDPELLKLNIWSRGRFGNWKYEVANQDHSCMLGVEAVDNILFETYEEILHEPNTVNGKKGKRVIVPPAFKDRWDLVVAYECGDPAVDTWLPPLLRDLATGAIRTRTTIHNTCPSTVIDSDAAWAKGLDIKVQVAKAKAPASAVFTRHLCDMYDDVLPMLFLLRATAGAPVQHPAPSDLSLVSDPDTRAAHLYEATARKDDPGMCALLELLGVDCPVGIGKMSSMHVARGTVYRLLKRDLDAACAALAA